MAPLKTWKGRKRRGLSTVEAALVVPLILLLTFGVMEYGWMFLKAQQISNAARHGARTAVRPGATNAEVVDAVSNLLTAADLGGSGYSVNLTPADVSTPETGEAVTVQVSVPGSSVTLFGGSFLPRPAALSSSVTMAKEGP